MSLIRKFKDRAYLKACAHAGFRRTLGMFRPAGVILMMHRVVPEGETCRLAGNRGLEITPGFLERLLVQFKQDGFEAVSLDRMHGMLTGRERLVPFVVYTFDDGYRDNYERAYPLFQKHQVPFTVYVTTCFPDGEAVMWWYLLEDLLLERDSLVFSFEGSAYKYAIRTLAEKEEAFAGIRRLLMTLSPDRGRRLCEILFGDSVERLAGRCERLAMSWAHLVEMSRNPLVTIAAHSVSHGSFAYMEDHLAREEMEKSRKKLAERIQSPVRHFAYPYGDTPATQTMEDSGFLTCTTVRQSMVFKEHAARLFALPRVTVSGDVGSADDFFKKLHEVYAAGIVYGEVA